tara:strand:+ start:399 stop:1040 length:642 start_codon:yes stop_codon:yes gene_type:complete
MDKKNQEQEEKKKEQDFKVDQSELDRNNNKKNEDLEKGPSTKDNEKENKKENSDNDLANQIEELKGEKLRLLAEMENLRKRTEKDKIDSIKYGSSNLARDILSPGDNLKRALEAAKSNKSNSFNDLVDGLKMVEREFLSVLEKHGIKKIEALHNKFDHNLHQAMMEIENDEFEEGVVIQEVQTGYTMHDRLLRPAMVGVSKKTKKDQKNHKKD